MASFTSPQGVQMVEIREFMAKFRVHPKHAPFIIGAKGATIKAMCKKSGAFIRIENPKGKDTGEFPWFKITANNIRAVEHGYQLVYETANKADQKMPLMGKKQSPPPLPSPSSDKNDTKTPTPESPSYSPNSPTYSLENSTEQTNEV